ncbi:MAG: methyltransferase domain-containing protein, partial [Leptolyngbyaceae cyanobacterium bins.59]|nr:methyltransferase domain-containing protein [Leptolyngbyaceae cyanobacterium bins.59]
PTPHTPMSETLQTLQERLARNYELAERDYPIGDRTLKIFHVANNFELLDRIDPQEFEQDERLPYWAEVWPASIALAEWVLSHPNHFQTRCLELGSGVGVVSVAAALAGATLLTTDYFSDALDFARLNAAVNQVTIEPYLLDWREITLTESFDCILAADVLYEARNHRPILQAIDRLLAPTGTAYLGDPQRSIAQPFSRLAQEFSFRVERTTVTVAWEGRSLPVDLYQLTRNSG